MLKVNICKCGRPEINHTVGCYGNPYPDLYEQGRTIICALSKEQLEEFFERLEGSEGCNFTEDGKWICDSKTTSFSKKILINMNIHPDDISNILTIFKLFGGYCDCEILFNAEERVIELFNKPSTKNIREIQDDIIKEYEQHNKKTIEMLKTFSKSMDDFKKIIKEAD